MADIINLESTALLRKVRAEDPKRSIVGLFEVLAVYDKVFQPKLHWIAKGGLGAFELHELTPPEEQTAAALLKDHKIEPAKSAGFYDYITARQIVAAPGIAPV